MLVYELCLNWLKDLTCQSNENIIDQRAANSMLVLCMLRFGNYVNSINVILQHHCSFLLNDIVTNYSSNLIGIHKHYI